MRASTDMPKRRRRGSGRGRIILIVVALLLFVLITSLRGVAGFYTDYLWFESLDLTQVFTGILGAKIALGAVFTAIFFVLLFVNLTIADRIAPKFRPAGPEDDLLTRYHQMVDRRAGLVRGVVSFLFALIAGIGVSSEWNQWLLFRNGGSFGVSDATFGTDVGFYVFKLPFYTAVVQWLFASVVIILLVTIVAHYLNGGIRLQSPFQRVTPQVKAHISVLLALLALIKAVDYWLQRYQLTFSTRGAVDGATYTDVKAQLPAIYLLLLISLLSCGLFIVNIWRRGWVLPVVAVGLWGFVALIAGTIYPLVIQRVVVVPAESSKEAPYITNNIAATRQAMGLDSVQSKQFDYTEDRAATSAAVANNPETIRNIRLLDPKVVTPTYQRLQGNTAGYRFNDLDVDRYPITTPSGVVAPTQVVLSNRDLNVQGVPQQSWEGRHIAYTHGYGLALSAANAVEGNGRPDFLVKDIPLSIDTNRIDITVDRPQLYFGENISGYAIVGTQRDEIDYLTEGGATATNAYDGKGGVALSSWIRKAAFAARFGDWNPLISNFVTDQSRILYIRDIKERLKTVAPFLKYDNDPYPVVANGRIVFIADAYTTTDQYPNAQRADTSQLPPGSGLNARFNYVRNSVKAVIDTYDGSVKMYVVDPNDPIAAAYAQAFPRLFAPGDEMPSELRVHWRYPEDMFRVQTNMWGRYHITDSQSFYEQTNAWSVAQDPGVSVSTGSALQTTPQVTTPTGQVARAKEPRIDPYYLLMQPPGEDKDSFLAMRSFVPYSDDDSKKKLTAFMIAKSDPEDYGKLITYEIPSDQNLDGPAIISSSIAANEDVSRNVSLLNTQGSKVIFGNLLLVPIDNTIVYVRPLYVSAEGTTAVPELKDVIVVSGQQNQRVVMKPTLREALTTLFPGVPVETFENGRSTTPDTGAAATPDNGSGSTTTTTPSSGEPSETAQQLIADAQKILADAETNLKNTGDLGAYQAAVRSAQDKLRQALDQGANPSTTTTSQPPASA